MILERHLKHRLSTTLRSALIVAGAAVLPWAPGDAFGQRPETVEPAAPQAEEGTALPARGEEPGQADQPPAGAPKRGERAESPGASPRTGAGGAPRGPGAPGGLPPGPAGDLEARLSRVEGQIAEMMAEIRSLRSSLAAPERAGLAAGEMPSRRSRPRASTPGLEAAPGVVWREAVTGGVRHVLKSPGILEATDLASGKVIWKTIVGELGDLPTPEMEVSGDEITITDYSSKNTALLDARTGRIISLAGPPPGAPGSSGRASVGLEVKPRAGSRGGIGSRARLAPPSAEPEQAPGARLRKMQDDLQVEKARLRARLAEIEAREAEVQEELNKLKRDPAGARP